MDTKQARAGDVGEGGRQIDAHVQIHKYKNILGFHFFFFKLAILNTA